MKSEEIMEVLDQTNVEYRQEALDALKYVEKKSRRSARKLLKTALIAAVIAALLIGSVYAMETYINSPQAAEKVALQEIDELKKLGLLNEEVSFTREPDEIVVLNGLVTDEYWFGRVFGRRYEVRWYQGMDKYDGYVSVDTGSGKINEISLFATADETDVPDWTEDVYLGDRPDPDPDDYVAWNFYRNFEDIIPADLTVGKCCSLLAEYWGFTGYTISDTVDSFYGEDWKAVSEDSLLKDMPLDNYYLTVYFEGDQSGVPMYIQLYQFPGNVGLTLGTGHAVG